MNVTRKNTKEHLIVNPTQWKRSLPPVVAEKIDNALSQAYSWDTIQNVHILTQLITREGATESTNFAVYLEMANRETLCVYRGEHFEFDPGFDFEFDPDPEFDFDFDLVDYYIMWDWLESGTDLP